MLPEPVLVDRVLDADLATALVGTEVDERPANVTTATVARDRETGEPVYAYLPLGDVSDLRRVARGITYGELVRSKTGVRNRSRVFGWAPRRPVQRRENCNATGVAKESPAEHAILDGWAGRLQAMLGEIEPGLLTDGLAATSVVLPDWRMDDGRSIWTSGVINRTSQLPYHRDGFNFPVWSAMPVVRRGVTGGHLHLPEYGATIACRDGWGVFFAGHNLVHGVTPMRLTAPDGYRYSIVYYSLRGMKDCHTAAEETRRGQAMRTQRERGQAELARARLAGVVDDEHLAKQALAGLREHLAGTHPHPAGCRVVLGGPRGWLYQVTTPESPAITEWAGFPVAWVNPAGVGPGSVSMRPHRVAEGVLPSEARVADGDPAMIEP